MKFNISFTGRKNGAIGIFYKINETVSARNEQEAILKLYNKYEHIKVLKIEVIK